MKETQKSRFVVRKKTNQEKTMVGIFFVALFVAMFFGIGVGKASAATYYVKWDAAGAGNGTSFADAYTTVQAAVNAATHGTSGNYDVIEISGGTSGHTYTENVTAAHAYVEMKQTAQAGNNGAVTISGSGSGNAFTNGAYGSWKLTNLTFTSTSTTAAAVSTWNSVYDGCTIKDASSKAGQFNGDTLNKCRIVNSAFYGGGVSLLILAGNTTFNYCTFEKNGGPIRMWTASFSATFNNCIFAGNVQLLDVNTGWTSGSMQFNDCLITANASISSNGTAYLMHNASSNSVVMKNCLIQSNPVAADMSGNHLNYFDVGITDGGGNIYSSPQLSNPRADGLIGFEIDDFGNLDAWTQVADYANAKGIKIAFALSTPQLATSSDWDTIAQYAQAGNEVHSHSMSHIQLSQYATNRFRITNTAGISPTVSISVNQADINPANWTGTMTLKEDGVIVAEYDLTDPLYSNLGVLQTAINGIAGGRWNAAFENDASIYRMSSLTLRGITDVSCNSTLSLAYEDNLIGSAPTNRLWYYEVVYSKKIIEDNLSSRISGGYVVKALTYPGNDNSEALRAFVMNQDNFTQLGLQAYVAARAGGTSGGPLSSWDTAQVRGLQIGQKFALSGLPNNLIWYIDYARYWGMATVLYEHDLGEWSLNNWKLVIDTVLMSEVQTKTISQMKDFVVSSGLWTTSDSRTYSRTYNDYDLDYSLNSSSASIDSGVSAPLTTDFIENPIYGTPDIGSYEYQPPHTMGTDEVDITAGARIYGDGKFRDLNTASSNTADLKITPESGSFASYNATDARPDWMDITNITWNKTGNHSKQWTESSDVLGTTNTLHTIGDLEPEKNYNISVDSILGQNIEGANGTTCLNGICKSNSEGEIAFLYTGGYSVHTFNVAEGDNIAPATISNINSGTYVSIQLVTLTCDDGAGTGCDKTYYTTDNSNPTTSSTVYSTPIQISTTTTLKFFSADLNGNQEEIQTKTYTIDTTPPVISNQVPNGQTLAAGTASVAVSIATDKNATCKYSTTSGTDFGSMTNFFTTTGSTSHSFIVANLSDSSSHGYFIRCQGQLDNPNTSDTLISFSVASPTVTTTPNTSSNNDNKKNGSGSKKEKTPPRKISNSKKVVKIGMTLTQRGKKFSKSTIVKVYLSKYGGGYNAPINIKTSKTGAFVFKTKISSRKGTYNWYVVDTKTKKKSRVVYYRVK